MKKVDVVFECAHFQSPILNAVLELPEFAVILLHLFDEWHAFKGILEFGDEGKAI